MPEVELSAGTIEYEDTGGSGPVIVLLHGLTMDGSMWRHVVAGLRPDHRCILPTLPLGGHRRPMRPDADLSLGAMVRLVAEFLERLDLRDVTLVGNDWGGAQLLVSEGRAERVGRLVLVACEAFDNYPPGLPGKAAGLAAKVPGGINAAFQPLRLRPLRRLPFTWGWMSKRPVPNEVMDAWFRPVLTRREIRRDLRKYAGSVPPKDVLLEWAERQRAFEGPVLVVWASEDRVMPREHGRRLAELFPDARLVEVPDSYTLIPEDQPAKLIAHPRVRDGAARHECIGHRTPRRVGVPRSSPSAQRGVSPGTLVGHGIPTQGMSRIQGRGASCRRGTHRRTRPGDKEAE